MTRDHEQLARDRVLLAVAEALDVGDERDLEILRAAVAERPDAGEAFGLLLALRRQGCTCKPRFVPANGRSNLGGGHWTAEHDPACRIAESEEFERERRRRAARSSAYRLALEGAFRRLGGDLGDRGSERFRERAHQMALATLGETNGGPR